MKDLIRSVGLTFLLDQKKVHGPYAPLPVFPAFSTYCDFNVVQAQVAGYAFGFNHPVVVQLPWQTVEGTL